MDAEAWRASHGAIRRNGAGNYAQHAGVVDASTLAGRSRVGRHRCVAIEATATEREHPGVVDATTCAARSIARDHHTAERHVVGLARPGNAGDASAQIALAVLDGQSRNLHDDG